MNTSEKQKLLVFRFSAFGDVAMTVPVIREFLNQNPEVEIIYVSREKFSPLFESIPRLSFFVADLNGKHKGFLGIYRLAKELQQQNATAIADLHNVLRTKIIRNILSAYPTSVLDKGRKERKALVRQKNKIKKQLKPVSERYADVFRNLGFSLKLSHQLVGNPTTSENAIGIAPFALHPGKMFPLEKMKSVALKLAENGYKIYLFGGGSTEEKELKEWEKLHTNIESLVGKLNLLEELESIKKLKLMISMDSANMHLASLVGTKVISIWGNTHPFMGFLGYGQSNEHIIQDESLSIRPTSIFGRENVKFKGFDYFKNISEEMVLEKVLEALNNSNQHKV